MFDPSLTYASAPAPARELAATSERELARNRRILQLAEHNGYATVTFPRGDSQWWRVPAELETIAGAMVLRV